MTDNIKKSLKERSKLTKIFYKKGKRKTGREKVLEKATECTNEILEAKKNYIKMSKKLEDSHAAPKAYWTILNCLIYNKKTPAAPPLFVDGNLFQIVVQNKTFLINKNASICTSIKNTSVLPPFSCKTNTRMDSFKVTENDILLIIKSLDSTKAHRCGNLSIRMIKMCSELITLPLSIIF